MNRLALAGRVIGAALILAGAAQASPRPAGPARPDSAVRRLLATRAELQALVTGPDGEAAQARLAEGDFVPGDRVLLRVDLAPELTDTFAVQAGPELVLPLVGVVPLKGVLRSEIETYLSGIVASYLRSPVVRAKALIRVGVMGEVVRPGYQQIPADALLADLVTAAGGLTRDAKPAKLRLERDGETLLDGDSLRGAMDGGMTLDQAGIEAGDRLIVPRRSAIPVGEAVRTFAVILTIPLTVFSLTKIF